jgi:hypothetical protein
MGRYRQMYRCNVVFGGSMKPSNWLLAAMRALAASMMDLTTRTRVFAADIGEGKVVPGGDSKMPCVRYVGDACRLGTHPCMSLLYSMGKQTLSQRSFLPYPNWDRIIKVLIWQERPAINCCHWLGKTRWFDTKRIISPPNLRSTRERHAIPVSPW